MALNWLGLRDGGCSEPPQEKKKLFECKFLQFDAAHSVFAQHGALTPELLKDASDCVAQGVMEPLGIDRSRYPHQ